MKIFFLSVLLGLQAFALNPVDGLSQEVKDLHNLLNKNECDFGDDFYFGPTKHNLAAGTDLYLVPCLSGAYNFTYVAYLVQNSMVSPVSVLAWNVDQNGKGYVQPTRMLVNVDYDPKSHTLSTFGKGRGIGDCGDSSVTQVLIEPSSYVSFKTTEIRSKFECDGEVEKEWPIVFKQ